MNNQVPPDSSSSSLVGADATDKLQSLIAFTERVMITFRNYYAQAISRSVVEDVMAEWLQLRKDVEAPVFVRADALTPQLEQKEHEHDECLPGTAALAGEQRPPSTPEDRQ